MSAIDNARTASKITRDQAEAEAARRYPKWDTPSADQERHRAGYWGFLGGAGWAANHTNRVL